jgi:hypothetical protein
VPIDFHQQLARQIGFLLRSCELYDRGDREEAIRLGVTLRVLFHDTRTSISLMTHLGSPPISLISTVEPDPLAKLQLNLIYCVIDPGCQVYTAIPRGVPDYGTRLVPLDTWWDREIVFSADQPNQTPLVPMTRKQLVLVATNKDGGAHVDSSLDAIYDQLESGAGLTVNFSPDFGPKVTLPLKDSHLASLRQIAAEVLTSEALLVLQGNFRKLDHKPVISHARAPGIRRAVFVRWCRETRVWGRVSPVTGECLASSDPAVVQRELRQLMLMA